MVLPASTGWALTSDKGDKAHLIYVIVDSSLERVIDRVHNQWTG